MKSPFADRLARRIQNRRSRVCLGLDPDPARLPAPLLDKHRLLDPEDAGTGRWRLRAAACVQEFCEKVLAAAAGSCAAAKPQMAWFEALGPEGMQALRHVAERAAKLELPLILDGKRNDIGHTAAQYARAYLGPDVGPEAAAIPADALTVSPYLGADGIAPFVQRCRDHGCGVFVLAATSNPSGAQVQDLALDGGGAVAERVAELIRQAGQGLAGPHGYGPVGAVVGATRPEMLGRMRELMPESIFLLPGFGAQGAGPDDVAEAFDEKGLGAVVNASRSLLFATPDNPDGMDFPERCAQRAEAMRQQIEAALERAGKPPPEGA